MSEVLSIVVPIYNVEDWLAECLDSIYQLNAIRYEVILVNDGSTDTSFDIAKQYSERYASKTRIINKPNGGLSDARNVGVKHANGEYIAFIDSDDFVNADVLTQLVNNAITEKLDVAVGTGFSYFSKTRKDKLISASVTEVWSDKPVDGINFLQTSFQNRIFNNVTVWDKVYKRAFLLEHNLEFIKGRLHEDMPYTFAVFTAAKRVKFYPLSFYYYRQREGSIMQSMGKKNILDKLANHNTIFDELRRKGVAVSELDDFLMYQTWMLFKLSGYIDKRLLSRLLLRFNLSRAKFIRTCYLLCKPSSKQAIQ